MNSDNFCFTYFSYPALLNHIQNEKQNEKLAIQIEVLLANVKSLKGRSHVCASSEARDNGALSLFPRATRLIDAREQRTRETESIARDVPQQIMF